MKVHSSDYKNNVKQIGRELDSIITYEENGETVELGVEELNSITPHYEGSILKSVMKQLDIDSNVEIPLNTVLNYQFGVKVDDEYEYLNFGNYIVYSSEKQEDTNSWKIVCYDSMLYTMKPYENMNITYPITIRSYIAAICDYLNMNFANAEETFVNYDKEIQSELYLGTEQDEETEEIKYVSLDYTFRDVLDEIAQATASTICINDSDELEIRYIRDSEDTVDEEFLKDINVNFGEQFGPINTIVLSRSAGSDKIYKSYPDDLPDDEKIAIEISDNQIMNGDDRDSYLPGLLDELYSLQYSLNDFSSTGITYYDLCDRYTVQIGENDYSCIMFNDEIIVTQGLQENIHTDRLEESETDYTKADKTDRRINRATLIVDKQQNQIESLIAGQTEQTEQIAQVIQNVNSIQNLFQITGGSNLIKNSQGLLDDEVWESTATEFIKGYDAELIGKTIAVAKLGVSDGKISTTVGNITNLLIGNTYTLNYYITNEEDTETTVRLKGNETIYEKTFTEACEMQEESFEFIADTSNYIFEVETTTTQNGFAYIYDLMLNSGDKKSWEPASGEIVGTVIKLSQLGLQIYCTGSNIATLMTAQGFQIRRFQSGELYEIITEFTDEGLITNKINYTQDNMDGLVHKSIQSDGYKKFVSYIAGGDI